MHSVWWKGIWTRAIVPFSQDTLEVRHLATPGHRLWLPLPLRGKLGEGEGEEEGEEEMEVGWEGGEQWFNQLVV